MKTLATVEEGGSIARMDRIRKNISTRTRNEVESRRNENQIEKRPDLEEAHDQRFATVTNHGESYRLHPTQRRESLGSGII
jgi:hypothetical protein